MRHKAQVASPAEKARATEMTRDFQVKVFKSLVWREAVRLSGSGLGLGGQDSAGPHYTLTGGVVRKEKAEK
jgi:hypothetical protein